MHGLRGNRTLRALVLVEGEMDDTIAAELGAEIAFSAPHVIRLRRVGLFDYHHPALTATGMLALAATALTGAPKLVLHLVDFDGDGASAKSRAVAGLPPGVRERVRFEPDGAYESLRAPEVLAVI